MRRMTVVTGSILLIAAWSAGRAGQAEPAGGAWGTRAPLLEANSEMSVAELGGRVYVVGGYPSSRVTVATVQVYDPAADAWTRTVPLPQALNHTMPAVVNGKLYIIGGQPGDSSDGPWVDSVYEYDPAADSWRARAPMPTPRGGGAAAVAGGRIYVAGGRPPHGHAFAAFDPATNAWTTLPDLPTQRNHLAAVAVDGKVFVVGGRAGGSWRSEGSDAVEVFDPATGAWSKRAAMPRPRGGINAVEALGCIHVFGGETPDDLPKGVFPDHDVYDPRQDAWTKLDSMPVPVHGVTGAAFIDGLIHLPGGGTERGGRSGSTVHQVYRPAMDCRP